MQVPNFSRPPAQHAITSDIPSPTPLLLVQWSQLLPLITRLETLEKELTELKQGQSEWVDTKEALRMTGLKCGDTLKAERERPNTRVRVKFEGSTNKQPRYLRSSLIAYNEARTLRHHVAPPLD